MHLRQTHSKTSGHGQGGRWGFTLIEIMIVIGIMAIVLTVGVPSMYRAMQKNEMAKAVKDIREGCQLARERAILHAHPYRFVMRQDGTLLVTKDDLTDAVEFGDPVEEKEEAVVATKESSAAAPTTPPQGTFPRKLGEDVIIQLIDVNFRDHMQSPEASVRFFPNGTADEFTVVLAYKDQQRRISTDVVTGIADEVVQ